MSDLLPIERARLAKFPAGQSMSIDEVAKVVGPAFKEMNQDPPDSVVKLREEMMGKTACGCEDNLPVEEAMFSKGKDVPLEKLPKELQQNVKNPPPGVQDLKDKMKEAATRCPNCGSNQVREKEYGYICLACDHGWEDGDITASKTAAAGLYGFTRQTQRDVEATVRKAEKRAADIAKKAIKKDPRVATFLEAHLRRNGSVSAKLLLASLGEDELKTASNSPEPDARVARSLYGHPTKTAELGLSACAQMRLAMGEFAFDLHSRRTDKYAQVTGFLREHSKKARCAYSKMMLACYPEHQVRVFGEEKTAAVETAGIEKEIGAEVKGPLESLETDEPWMKGEFTQQEFSELSEKQEKAQLGKTASYLVEVRFASQDGTTLKDVQVTAHSTRVAAGKVEARYDGDTSFIGIGNIRLAEDEKKDVEEEKEEKTAAVPVGFTPGLIVETVQALRNKGPGNDVNIPKGAKFRIVRDGGSYLDVSPVNKNKYSDESFIMDYMDVVPVAGKTAFVTIDSVAGWLEWQE